MLPRLVALIAASTILLGLASTLVATFDEPTKGPQAPATRAQAVAYNATVSGLPTLSDESAVTPDELAGLMGAELLHALALSDIVSLERFARGHPEAVAALLSEPPPASVVAGWWSSVPAGQRHSLLRTLPRLLGNLEGMPYAVRDTANRAFLQSSLRQLEVDVASTTGRSARHEAESRLSMLREIEKALGPGQAAPMRSLIAVDDTWPGRAVVALGDLDVADYVSYLVPGMFFTVEGQIVDWTEIALDIHRDKAGLVRGVSEEASVASASFATVAWMGYETPDIFTVGTLDKAREGAEQLDATVAGLREARGADQPHVSLIAHSYGSTAASLSLARGTLDIDAIAIAGSPGVGVERAADFGLAEGTVFVAEANWDPIVDTAIHGADPGAPDFGAIVMGVAGGIDDATGETLAAVTGHLGYFAKHSESMRNFALIGLGLGERVTGTSGQQLLAAG
ncbi:alpha/beta hydrolase [Salinibacterium sp. GXW1014]|uniref:alpha/beta hydrolase n=1 Tax=Salinibacterium sp. GXW1014 TaxID=3377838 RepID=UPI00383B995A